MKKMKKILLTSGILLLPLIFLAGCSKVSLTGSTTGTPADGEMGTPPEGEMGTPPEGAPTGAPAV
jgi:hypothetical protein